MNAIATQLPVYNTKSDPVSFEGIYRENADYVYTVSYGIVLNHDDAREVAQEVFLKVYKNLSSFRYDSSIKTWLYRITINESLNYIKKHRARKMVTLDLEQMDNALAHPTADVTEAAGSHAQAVAMLAALKPGYRACVVLRNIQGLSYQEIADILNENINTVRTRLRRAREQLLQSFKGGESK